ncbi:MAG: prepilin-type N-terminal cleavage/methylation domain-containing protein [Gammaproteobacteria bacterium]|nr:prepilin-type N-terminal cleavage/methylation domain-containing protein [Gammaproteobacteria bacterium]
MPSETRPRSATNQYGRVSDGIINIEEYQTHLVSIKAVLIHAQTRPYDTLYEKFYVYRDILIKKVSGASMKKEYSFSLLEMLIVIVIIGFLIRYALPKFENLERSARVVSVMGTANSFRSIAALVHGLCLSNLQLCQEGNITIENSSVAVDSQNFYPLATTSGVIAAIANAAENSTIYDKEGNISIAINLLTHGAACNATYKYANATMVTPTVIVSLGEC